MSSSEDKILFLFIIGNGCVASLQPVIFTHHDDKGHGYFLI